MRKRQETEHVYL